MNQESKEALIQKLNNIHSWTMDDALLNPEIRQHLVEMKIARENNLENQVKAHADEIKVICLKKWFGLRESTGWDNTCGDNGWIDIIKFGRTEIQLPDGKNIAEYDGVLPLLKLEPILKLDKTKIFDEIKIYDKVYFASETDPFIVGKMGRHYLLLAQWE